MKFNTCFDDASSCPVVLVTNAWTCYCLNYTCTFNSTTLFSRPLRVIIAKLTISLCHHDNSILTSLRFHWEMFLKSFFTAHFYTDVPMNQHLWFSALYNSKKKNYTDAIFVFNCTVLYISEINEFIFINQISHYLGVHCKQYIQHFLAFAVCQKYDLFYPATQPSWKQSMTPLIIVKKNYDRDTVMYPGNTQIMVDL